MCPMCVQCLRKPEEDAGTIATGVTGSSELPCGCYELNPGSLQEQPELSLLTVSSAPAFTV